MMMTMAKTVVEQLYFVAASGFGHLLEKRPTKSQKTQRGKGVSGCCLKKLIFLPVSVVVLLNIT